MAGFFSSGIFIYLHYFLNLIYTYTKKKITLEVISQNERLTTAEINCVCLTSTNIMKRKYFYSYFSKIISFFCS